MDKKTMSNHKPMHRLLLTGLFSMLLSIFMVACSSESAYVLEPQYWGDMEFLVEIRPGTPQVGMNEFLVVATERKGKPGFAFVISLQMQGGSKWAQAIQDGRSGVYRRAIYVKDPINGILRVKVSKRVGKQKTEEKVFDFPLSRLVPKSRH